jgi:hypothetical protein
MYQTGVCGTGSPRAARRNAESRTPASEVAGVAGEVVTP